MPRAMWLTMHCTPPAKVDEPFLKEFVKRGPFFSRLLRTGSAALLFQLL
jgi:hypothetical protein